MLKQLTHLSPPHPQSPRTAASLGRRNRTCECLPSLWTPAASCSVGSASPGGVSTVESARVGSAAHTTSTASLGTVIRSPTSGACVGRKRGTVSELAHTTVSSPSLLCAMTHTIKSNAWNFYKQLQEKKFLNIHLTICRQNNICRWMWDKK